MKLINGESFDFKSTKKRRYLNVSSEEISKKYYNGQVRIVTEQARYPLNTIVAMIDSGNYDIQPDFQRRHRWDIERKSKLIESFIINVPIPPIFLYENEYAKFEVMDGLQRLSTIYDFYQNQFCLEGLTEWPELNGYDYNSLPEIIKLGIDRRYLSSIILLQETAKTEDDAQMMKQLVFERLNSGGVDLSDQETRNALYNGQLNQLCVYLSENDTFRKLFGIPSKIIDASHSITSYEIYDKMDDVELVLRFFAFRQIEKWDGSYIKHFLDSYLIHGNLYTTSTLNQLERIFDHTIGLVFQVFGKNAFKLWRPSKSRRDIGELKQATKPTKVLYDPIMYVFCQHLDDWDIMIEKKIDLSNGLKNLFVTHQDKFISRFNKNDIINRCELIEDLVASVIGD